MWIKYKYHSCQHSKPIHVWSPIQDAISYRNATTTSRVYWGLYSEQQNYSASSTSATSCWGFAYCVARSANIAIKSESYKCKWQVRGCCCCHGRWWASLTVPLICHGVLWISNECWDTTWWIFQWCKNMFRFSQGRLIRSLLQYTIGLTGEVISGSHSVECIDCPEAEFCYLLPVCASYSTTA